MTTRHPQTIAELKALLISDYEGDIAFKALSLLQPWASLMAIGAKRYETRSWQTPFRGLIAIHASAGKQEVGIVKDIPFCTAFNNANLGTAVIAPKDVLPFGSVVCFVDLNDCLHTEDVRNTVAIHGERCFGDYSDNRFAWQTKNVLRLASPIKAKGALSIWGWTVTASALREAMKGNQL